MGSGLFYIVSSTNRELRRYGVRVVLYMFGVDVSVSLAEPNACEIKISFSFSVEEHIRQLRKRISINIQFHKLFIQKNFNNSSKEL